MYPGGYVLCLYPPTVTTHSHCLCPTLTHGWEPKPLLSVATHVCTRDDVHVRAHVRALVDVYMHICSCACLVHAHVYAHGYACICTHVRSRGRAPARVVMHNNLFADVHNDCLFVDAYNGSLCIVALFVDAYNESFTSSV